MSSQPAFDLVALDMAGTTLDEGGMVYDVLQASVADAIGQPVPSELVTAWKGTSKEEAAVGMLTGLGHDASPQTVSTLMADFTERITLAYRETPPKPIPGVEEMFATLRSRGVKIALQTGYSARIADAILSGVGWSVGETIDALVTSDAVAASRPAPYLIFHCMEATGVTDVRRVLAAGDTPNDLGAGTNAGCGYVVGVATGSFTHEQLAVHPHTHLLDSTASLAELL